MEAKRLIMLWSIFLDRESFKKHMDESLDGMRAEQERRRKEEEEMWDPGGRNKKMVREAEVRFCEEMKKLREKDL